MLDVFRNINFRYYEADHTIGMVIRRICRRRESTNTLFDILGIQTARSSLIGRINPLTLNDIISICMYKRILSLNFNVCPAYGPVFGDFSDVPSGKILYVTSDNYETVREFRERDIVARHVDMDIILEDKILKDYFRHDYIPHYVIVGEGGQVRAQVNEVEMDRGLISAVKDNPHLIIENEHTTEGKTQPLFLADRYGKSTDYMYSFFRMGFDPTYGGANIKRRNDNGIYSITLANTSLKTLVTEIAKLYADSFRLEFTPSFVEGMEHIGKQDFSYEFAVPEGEEGAFFDRLIDDVSRYITIRIDPRTRKQEVLTISSRTIMDKGARTKLARDIGEKLENAWTVIDYTDSYSKENLLVEGNDINSIREFLAKKGYLLEKKTISLPYIVVGK